MHLYNAKRLVVKVGSSLLIGEDGRVNAVWLAAFARDIARCIARGTQVIIVTSGAVALGRGVINAKGRKLKLEEKQAAAACGQIMLVEAWREHLATHAIATAQILLTLDDSENRKRYLNARTTFETLLAHNIVPVINENDTVATAELRFGDNDRLAARVAQMTSSDMLVLFSDIDGLYSSNPNTHKDATFIQTVNAITPEIEAMAGGVASHVGTGGMVTKLEAAKIALSAGCTMVIALGKSLHPLQELEKTHHGTWFIPASTPINARKNWIKGALSPTGTLIIDEGAEAALRKGKSLLPAGVTRSEGAFEQGDCVTIKNTDGITLARGLVSYSHEETHKIIGQKSTQIEKILGYSGKAELIHRDNLVAFG